MVISTEEEIRFRLQPMAEDAGMESDHPISDAAPSTPGSPPKNSRRAGSPLLPLYTTTLFFLVTHPLLSKLPDPAELRQ